MARKRTKQNRSTEGCSKLKRSVDMTSSGKNGLNIRTNASPKWDRTRCTKIPIFIDFLPVQPDVPHSLYSINFIFMPPDRMIGAYCLCSRIEWSGHIVFVLSVCLSVCLFVVNFNLRYNIWTVRDRDFIFGMHTPLMMPFQMTPRSMTLWFDFDLEAKNSFFDFVATGGIL